jgi:hypothetical protein
MGTSDMPLTTVDKDPVEVDENSMHSNLDNADLVPPTSERLGSFRFANQYTDSMAMNGDLKSVSAYLDQHQEWFTRCAQPMQVDALGDNGYAITIGSFNNSGFKIEPKVGLELLPQNNYVYRIQTIDIPNYTPPGYTVEFNAEMRLVEIVDGDRLTTKVDWDLDLVTYIQFPKFIYKLPHSFLQKTGDKVLGQIVRQVSRRLTIKVQQDFQSQK